MESERIIALEQALTEMQAKDAETQNKLDNLIHHLTVLTTQSTTATQPVEQTSQSPPTTPIPFTAPRHRGPAPALPSEFDGDRTKGLAFLTSCQIYIRLCPDNFSDEQAKIVWAMSYMKSGRAARWAARVFKWEEVRKTPSFPNWEGFRDEFKKEFCPAHTEATAINRLESTAYFQRNRSVDAYLDEFIDLIVEAGYTDAKTVVIKFRKGLDPQIQNAIATMTNGRPSDMDTGGWYGAARTIDENKATNEAFRSSYRSPAVTQTSTQAPSRPAFNALKFPAPKPSGPSPGNPVPMDVDAARKKLACYRCGSLEHLSNRCPLRFDIRNLSVEELQEHLSYRLAELDVAPMEPEPEEEKEDFVPNDE